MLKKTLLAASIAALTATPALAEVELNYGGFGVDKDTATTTILASVTKEAVLAFSTAEEEVDATFTVDGDLKQNGFITLELTGDATFNDNEVRQWLSTDASNPAKPLSSIAIDVALRTANVSADGLSGHGVEAGADLADVFKIIPLNASQDQIDYAIDLDGKRLRLALKQTTGTYDDMIGFGAAVTGPQFDTAAQTVLVTTSLAELNAALTAVGSTDTAVAGDNTGASPAGFEFKADGSAQDDAGKQAYVESLNKGVEAEVELVGYAEGGFAKVVAADTALNFDLKNANQIFNLKSGSTNDVAIKVGALKNASYSADPVASTAMFQLGKLFKLAADESGKATALVSTGFLKVDTDQPSNGVADDANIAADALTFTNLTSNQNIQLNKVKLTLDGDLNAFKANDAGYLVSKGDVVSQWKLNATKTQATSTVILGAPDSTADVLQGNQGLTAHVTLPKLDELYVAADNEIPVEAQKIAMTATILGSDQDTFNDFSHTLSELFIITRDGLKFDTILTGTTSSNTVHIRDVSGILPEAGGKIFVTVWEYDAHEAGENAERNVLAERKELTVKLPSNGAVTLSPATIAAQLGIEVAPARQARMLFEVETNVGEVAVKKSDGKGTDIQVGSQAAEKEIVDFTL